jgi:hypothetical protein
MFNPYHDTRLVESSRNNNNIRRTVLQQQELLTQHVDTPIVGWATSFAYRVRSDYHLLLEPPYPELVLIAPKLDGPSPLS